MSARGWAYALTVSAVLWALVGMAAALILRGLA